jgi:type II secretory pathway component PulJ
MSGRPDRRRVGLTALEAVLALTILGIISFKAASLMQTAGRDSATDVDAVILEDRAQLVLDQIARSIMNADRETLTPSAVAPATSSEMSYKLNLGVQDGEVVWSDTETYGLENPESQVFWNRTPDVGPELRLVLTRLASPYLEGEIPNGMDDNGNGLIDESGLSFVVDRNAVTIRLTLNRVTNDGRTLTATVETTVTCRNLPEE